MRDWIIGQGVIIYIFAGSLLVGLVSAFIANHGYKKYIGSRRSWAIHKTGSLST